MGSRGNNMRGRLEQGTESIFWLWDAFVPGQCLWFMTVGGFIVGEVE